MRFKIFIILVLLIGALSVLMPTVNAQETDSVPLQQFSNINEKTSIDALWNELLNAVRIKDIKTVNTLTFDLEKIRDLRGYANFEDYSLYLLSLGQKELLLGEKENAAFYVRRAFQLSPQSPRVVLNSFGLAEKVGVKTYWEQLSNLLSLSVSQLYTRLEILNGLIYPVLWALTMGFLAAYAMLFMSSMPQLLQGMFAWVPHRLRIITAPLLLSVFLIIPLLYGPLFTLFGWAICAMFFLKKNKSFVVLSAALLLCWGMAIPIKENMSAWLAKEGVQTMLRINSGIYSPDDAAKLENYIARNNSDLAAAYAYLLVLRRAGKLSEAEELLRSLRAAGFNVDKINLQQALIYFLTDRTDKAEQIFKDLLASGKSSAGILFNYSKIKFDLLDTEGSRDLFDQANKQDPVLMEQMQQREDLSGIKSPLSFAELGLSIGDVFSMSYNSNFDTEKTYNLNMLTVFQNLKTLNFAAILSLIISLIIPQSKMRRGKLNSEAFSSYRHSPVLYQTLRLIPGGSFALNGRPLAATFLCSLIALFLMPLLGWPQTTAYFLSSLKWAKIYYVYFVCFFIGSCCYIGFFDFEEDKI